jgi:hypothetical protein
VSHHAKATSSSLALRAVVADTKERRTAPHDAALPVLFVREQIRTEGFEPLYRHIYFIQNVLFIRLSLLCFKARINDPDLKNGTSRLYFLF